MTLPLSGTRIIAVEQYGAGPFGTMLLADLGAEVIKVENPADGGDVGNGCQSASAIKSKPTKKQNKRKH